MSCQHRATSIQWLSGRLARAYLTWDQRCHLQRFPPRESQSFCQSVWLQTWQALSSWRRPWLRWTETLVRIRKSQSEAQPLRALSLIRGYSRLCLDQPHRLWSIANNLPLARAQISSKIVWTRCTTKGFGPLQSVRSCRTACAATPLPFCRQVDLISSTPRDPWLPSHSWSPSVPPPGNTN